MIDLPRRGFLTLAGALALGVTGCQINDPRITGGPTAPPARPTPTPVPDVPGLEAALRHESDLVALSEQAGVAADRLRLGPGQRAALGWMSRDHGVHLTALLAPHPAERPTAPPTPGPRFTPRPEPTSSATLAAGAKDAAIGELTSRLEAALVDYRASARGSRGQMALLWGSLAAYARSAQAALVKDAPRPDPLVVPVRALEPWSDAEAEQQALRQVHALVYGYQAAIPWFRRPESQTAYDLLVHWRDLRDRITRLLRDRGQTAPAAEAAYALPVQPTDRNTAAELLWRMESAFAPFAGAWLAAATQDESRRMAADALEEAARLCLEWGGPMTVWPGWPG